MNLDLDFVFELGGRTNPDLEELAAERVGPFNERGPHFGSRAHLKLDPQPTKDQECELVALAKLATCMTVGLRRCSEQQSASRQNCSFVSNVDCSSRPRTSRDRHRMTFVVRIEG